MPEARNDNAAPTPTRSGASAPRQSFLHGLKVVPAIALSAVLVFLSFPDPSLDWLVWGSLLPLFFACRGVGAWRGFRRAWLAGIILEAMGFYWAFPAFTAYVGFSGYWIVVPLLLFAAWLLCSALAWGALGCLLACSRRGAHVHAAVAIWVAIEHYYPRLFPWHLGGALYEREWLRQGADIFGASGLTYLILLVHVLLYLLVEWRRGRSSFPRVTLVTVGLLLVVANVYGAMRVASLRDAVKAAPALKIGVMQPVVPPAVRRDRGPQGIEFSKGLLQKTYRLAERQRLDLIVWPEGMDLLPFNAESGADPLDYHYDKRTGKALFDGIAAPLLVGGRSRDAAERSWNTAAYVLPEGERFESGFRARLYQKNKLLLFGERLPLREHLPAWLRQKIPLGTLEAGQARPIFALRRRSPSAGTHRLAGGAENFYFRTLICYEVTLPHDFRTASSGVDFLINLTEDYWFGRTPHIRQHVSVIRMRAVENRVPLVRSTNVGPSGVIDVTGEFADASEEFVAAEKVVTVRPGSYFSLYRRGGFLFPLACLCLGLFLLVGPAGSLAGQHPPRAPPPKDGTTVPLDNKSLLMEG